MILNPTIECMDQQELSHSVIRPQLSSLFLRVYDQFSYYRRQFDKAGLDPRSDPIEILERLPFMTKYDYSMLESDALRHADRSLYHVEMTSGSTGRPKRRFQSYTDELNELSLAARVMAGFDLCREDVIVFMDVGDPSIYLWFAKACESLGLRDTIYYGIQSDFKNSLRRLIKLDPTVLFTVPSLLARSYETILQMYKEAGDTSLQKIIYFGEKMDDRFRKRLQEDLGVEIFSHYGGTEVSTLGGECSAHDGIHVYTDVNFPSLVAPKVIDETTQEGEVAWTTMQVDVQPVIKYRLGDVVCITYEKCKCGRTSPRVQVIGRTDEGFSLYGEKFYYDTFLDTIYSDIHETGFLQIILSSEKERERLTVILPEKLKSKEMEITESLYYMNELEFYLEEGFVELELKFVPNSYFTSRKIPAIIDNRRY
ncbi:phenylacetate--CoA ligase family protein [Candidatus Poribacteria bacterium]